METILALTLILLFSGFTLGIVVMLARRMGHQEFTRDVQFLALVLGPNIGKTVEYKSSADIPLVEGVLRRYQFEDSEMGKRNCYIDFDAPHFGSITITSEIRQFLMIRQSLVLVFEGGASLTIRRDSKPN